MIFHYKPSSYWVPPHFWKPPFLGTYADLTDRVPIDPPSTLVGIPAKTGAKKCGKTNVIIIHPQFWRVDTPFRKKKKNMCWFTVGGTHIISMITVIQHDSANRNETGIFSIYAKLSLQYSPSSLLDSKFTIQWWFSAIVEV